MLSEEELKERNHRIAAKAVAYIKQSGVKTVHIFLPILAKKEVDTWLIIQALDKEVQFVVPRMRSGGELDHYLLDEQCLVKVNNWGVPEPVQGNLADIVGLDMILVPLIVADKQGHRIGYGKGFYDRFLEKTKVPAIGLSLLPLLDNIEQVESHDTPLDSVLTPA